MSNIVISQIYGGGSSTGATYKDDFIELFNRGTTEVNLNGWKLQYASASGTTWQSATLPSFYLQPGQYYLVQVNAATSGASLPATPNTSTSAFSLATANGKVKLVDSTAQLVDLIGYGTVSGTTPAYEGAGAAPALSATTAAFRKEGGLIDTDNNAADFTTGAPNPHNSSQFERRPTATDKTFSLAEDHTYTFSEADFGYQDVDGNLLASVKITGLPWRGDLKLGNVAVVVNDVIPVASIPNLTYTPPLNVNSDTINIAFTVNDGITDSSAANQFTINLTPVNDPPVAGALFAPATQIAAGGVTPLSVALADVNGDGKLDIVTANNESNNVSILTGKGDGSFNTATFITVGTTPSSVALADVNKDNKVDLVVANWSGNNVSILTGNGDGSFNTATSVAVGTNPLSVALADVNGDGKLDIVTDNYGSNNVSILTGNGDGSFNTATTFAVGTKPQSVALADVNGDGKLDIVTANWGSNNVSILTGNGDGSFNTATSVAVGTSPASVALADVNGDGKQDIAVVGRNEVFIFTNKGDGTFNIAVAFETISLTAIALADINDDGKLDIITSSDWDRFVSILTGNGDGSFNAATTFAAGYFSYSVALADLNGDNKLDIVTANNRDNNVSVLLAAPSSVRLAEDGSYTFKLTDFGFQDPNDISWLSSGNNLKNVLITRLPSAGVLQLNGVALTAADLPNKAISVTDINDGKLTFQPAADGNGDSYASFDFKVQDDGDTADGGMDISENTATMTFAVTAVNDAPVASGTATLAAITTNTSNPVGDTVSNLFGSCFSDAKDQVSGGSSANTLAGIAISSYTADASKGAWQYSSDSGANWTALGNATTATALTLAVSDKLRFVPAPNYNGAATALTANLIETGENITNGQIMDLTNATGGATHISTTSVTLNTTINPPPAPPPPVPVNHAPTGAVTISGTIEVGQVLTAANTLVDANGVGTIAYQWKKSGTIVATNSTSYTLTAADVGKTITVTASYTDGNNFSEQVASSPSAAITDVPVVVPRAPTPVPVDTTPAPTPAPTPTPTPAPVDPTPAPVYSGGSEPAPVVVAPVIPPTFIADGVTVQQTFTTANGAQVGHFTAPPVSVTRVEDTHTAHPKAADIPLGSVNKNAGVALALPTGVGFQADGVTSPQFISTALGNLSDDTKAVFGAESAAVVAGIRFLFNTTANSQTFFEQKITLSYDPKTNINQPVIIDGTHTGSTSVLNTFVIDASALPKGSLLELKHVDFAVISGEVTVKLDPTSNSVHLGSTQTQQSVFAGAGDDVVQVDSGSRIIHGGLGTDTVKVAGKLEDYQLNQSVAKITLTSLTNPNDVQTLVNVEKVQFADQTQTFSFDDAIKAIAGTYQQMFGRQGDVNSVNFWTDAIKKKGLSLGQMAVEFMHSPEQLQKIGFDISKADIPTQVEQFYQSFLGRTFDTVGKAFWVDKLTTGELNLESLATTVIESQEMQSLYYAAAPQWNFSL